MSKGSSFFSRVCERSFDGRLEDDLLLGRVFSGRGGAGRWLLDLDSDPRERFS